MGRKARAGQHAAKRTEEKRHTHSIKLLVGGRGYRSLLKPGNALLPHGNETDSAGEVCDLYGLRKGRREW